MHVHMATYTLVFVFVQLFQLYIEFPQFTNLLEGWQFWETIHNFQQFLCVHTVLPCHHIFCCCLRFTSLHHVIRLASTFDLWQLARYIYLYLVPVMVLCSQAFSLHACTLHAKIKLGGKTTSKIFLGCFRFA